MLQHDNYKVLVGVLNKQKGLILLIVESVTVNLARSLPDGQKH